MTLGLEGIKVVDVSQLVAVPMAARHLADFGADVIHVEHPVTGDSWRFFQAGQGSGTSGVPSDINYTWENSNRNKRSVTIDVSREHGREILYKLVEKADVFLTNMRPFEMEKFKLEYDTLSRLNPGLIYCSLSGYGKKGPERDAPAYDATAYWARSGISYGVSAPGLPLSGYGTHFGDSLAAMALAYGVMTALFIRERTGIGQEVDLSLFDFGIYQLSFHIAAALVTGLDYKDWRQRSGEVAPNPMSGVYQTKDGRWLVFVVLQPDRYWPRFCRAIEREDLEHDPRFESLETRRENSATLHQIFEEIFLTKTLDEWKPHLKEIPFAPVQNFLEVINDPQAKANDSFISIDHPIYGRIKVIANPVKLSKTPASIRMPAPELGQHTEEVLLEHGYTWKDIEQFKQQRVIA